MFSTNVPRAAAGFRQAVCLPSGTPSHGVGAGGDGSGTGEGGGSSAGLRHAVKRPSGTPSHGVGGGGDAGTCSSCCRCVGLRHADACPSGTPSTGVGFTVDVLAGAGCGDGDLGARRIAVQHASGTPSMGVIVLHDASRPLLGDTCGVLHT